MTNDNKQKSILIIDDNKSITDMLSNYLTLKNFSCDVASDGKSGLDMIRKKKYDTIFLDLSMPDFSGFNVIESLEKNGMIKNLNIIVLTASAIKKEEIQGILQRGIKICIKKPLNLAELVKLIS